MEGLDTNIYDLQGKVLLQSDFDKALQTVKYKLAQVGFNELDIVLISSQPLNIHIPDDIDHCIDKNCGAAIYLLTFSANGKNLITPPYNSGTHSPMSWNEWAIRIWRGEQLSILNLAPWAQSKFINVE